MTFRCVTEWDTLGYFSSPELSVPLFCAPARQATASVCSKKKEGIKPESEIQLNFGICLMVRANRILWKG